MKLSQQRKILSNQKHRDTENLRLRLHCGESLKQQKYTMEKEGTARQKSTQNNLKIHRL